MVRQSKPSFWTTLPAFLTGTAALVTAMTGLLIGLHLHWLTGTKEYSATANGSPVAVPIKSTTCRTNGNNDNVPCQLLDVVWVPKSPDSEIQVVAKLTGVDLAIEGCSHPHRRAIVIVGCGNLTADSGDLGHNDKNDWQQDYSVPAYCKPTAGRPLHVTVTAIPRGCTRMTTMGGSDSVSITEVPATH